MERVRGVQPRRAYFYGCSTGGHQGYAEIQRYPEDFDGVIAGAPGSNRVRLNAGFLWQFLSNHQPGDNATPIIPASQAPARHRGRGHGLRCQRRRDRRRRRRSAHVPVRSGDARVPRRSDGVPHAAPGRGAAENVSRPAEPADRRAGLSRLAGEQRGADRVSSGQPADGMAQVLGQRGTDPGRVLAPLGVP